MGPHCVTYLKAFSVGVAEVALGREVLVTRGIGECVFLVLQSSGSRADTKSDKWVSLNTMTFHD